MDSIDFFKRFYLNPSTARLSTQPDFKRTELCYGAGGESGIGDVGIVGNVEFDAGIDRLL